MNKFTVKLIGNGAIVILGLLGFTNATFIGALLTAIVLTIVAYLLGDQLILRTTNNVIATGADAVLAAVVLYAAASAAGWSLSPGELFTIAALLGVFEYLFHYALMRDDDYRKAGM